MVYVLIVVSWVLLMLGLFVPYRDDHGCTLQSVWAFRLRATLIYIGCAGIIVAVSVVIGSVL